MSKHQEILDYLEALPIGKRVSVRSISNHLQVSDGTAYRAIKEAENRGLVETRPRSGTVRVEKKVQVRLDKLTFAEIGGDWSLRLSLVMKVWNVSSVSSISDP